MNASAHSRSQTYGWVGGLVLFLSVAGAGWFTAGVWWPAIARRLSETSAAATTKPRVQPLPGQQGHDESEHVTISPEAQQNIGLVLGQIERRDFDRSISLPAMVAERPGRSHIVVTTHFTGIVTKIHVAQGQAVKAGQPLFDLRLTHEELIQSQRDLLKTAQEIEILDREIARIQTLASEGGIAGKLLLERKYERERYAATMHAQRQALLLHEMNDEQIDKMLASKQLLGSLTLTALADEGMVEDADAVVLQVHELKIALGQHIAAGDTLAVLADYSQLLVEGEAFEQDLPVLSRALAAGWPLDVLPAAGAAGEQNMAPVKLLYLADQIDPAARTFHFYALLENEVMRDEVGPDGRRYVQWRRRPGERLRVQAPVERWDSRLVVPVAALAHDGVETYVFRYAGGEFQRTSVQVEHQGEQFAVLAEGGAVREGQVIAVSAAQQLQFALANAASGGASGHHHDH